MSSEEGEELEYKIVVIGDSNVGKSSIAIRYCKGQFSDMREPTVGASYISKIVVMEDGTPIKLQIWDTAGQEKFSRLVSMYYRGADGALVVYDVTNSNSLTVAGRWYDELMEKSDLPSDRIGLVGNKSDLSRAREVSINQGEEFAKERKMFFFETSAKTGENIQELFEYVSKMVYTGKTEYDKEENELKKIALMESETKNNGSSKCC